MDALVDAIMQRVAAHVGSVAQPRLATVSAFDPTQHAVRVTIQPEGTLSGWIPLGAAAVGNGVGIVAPPSLNDQVLVVHQEGDSEHPHVVGRLFSHVAMPPVSPATGKPVQPGEVGVFTPGAWLHISGGTVYGSATSWQLSGDVVVEGDVSDRHGSLDRLRQNYDAHRHGDIPLTDHPDAE